MLLRLYYEEIFWWLLIPPVLCLIVVGHCTNSRPDVGQTIQLTYTAATPALILDELLTT